MVVERTQGIMVTGYTHHIAIPPSVLRRSYKRSRFSKIKEWLNAPVEEDLRRVRNWLNQPIENDIEGFRRWLKQGFRMSYRVERNGDITIRITPTGEERKERRGRPRKGGGRGG